MSVTICLVKVKINKRSGRNNMISFPSHHPVTLSLPKVMKCEYDTSIDKRFLNREVMKYVADYYVKLY